MTGKDEHIPSDHEVRQWLILTSQADQTSFTLLMRAYWYKVYTQAITYLKSAELAQEITQDVFIKLWNIREKLTEVENFSNFLFILSRNEIITSLRKKRDISTLPSNDIEELILQPDKQLLYKESFHKILGMIEQLPPVRRKVFKMSRLEGKSYEEIGDELGISRNGVKDHIVKALNFLRTNFKADQLLFLILYSMLVSQ